MASRHNAMFNASPDNVHLASAKDLLLLPCMDFKLAVYDEEQFIFIGMSMPRHLIPLAPDQHHKLPVQLSQNLRGKCISE